MRQGRKSRIPAPRAAPPGAPAARPQRAPVIDAPPVLHIDAHLLAVHPGPRTPDSLERLLPALAFGFQRLPQPAHRLDRDTSGCLVLGRNPKAVKRLSALFEAGAVAKTYWAAVSPPPAGEGGVIDAPLLKVSSKAQGWRIVVDAKGKPARTRWRVLARQHDRALVEFQPETGRTHQVRVHAAHLGCPLLGDHVYGRTPGPMQLHARAIAIPFYEGQPPVAVTAPIPPHMADLGFGEDFA
jgi:tRNA pseudouridine32 synthase/23S rRNA pseudouridine746 synthase